MLIKKFFEPKCPECTESVLNAHRDSFCNTKVCPNCSYKEETYSSLGVNIVYKASK